MNVVVKDIEPQTAAAKSFLAAPAKNMLIGGEWLEAASGERFESSDPATGAVLGSLPRGGAEDVEESGDQWEVTSAPGDLAAVRGALEGAGVHVDQGEVTQLPTTSVPVSAENAPKVLRLVDALEDLDDVQAVYANFDIPDEVLVGLEA